MTRISTAQHNYLGAPAINSTRIASRSQGGKSLSYLESWDVRAALIRVFGFGNFDLTTEHVHQCYVRDVEVGQNKNPGIDVAYLVTMKLTIKDPDGEAIATYSETAVGSAVGSVNYGDLHDNAVKQASSDALKRCAINLGTQFGLSLYNDGSRQDVVRVTLVHPDGATVCIEPQAPGAAVTPEQQAVLESSLGAKVVSETPAETPAEQPAEVVQPDGSTITEGPTFANTANSPDEVQGAVERAQAAARS